MSSGKKICKKELDDIYRLRYLDDSYRQFMRTNADSQPNIGRAEMEILRYISDHHPVSVREVADRVCAGKGQVRTTALNVMERLHNVSIPTLIIVGAEDEMTPVKFAQYLADRIVGSKMVIIKNATHSVAMEKPDEVNGLIREWMDNLK